MMPFRRNAESAPAATYRDADAALVSSRDRGTRARRLRLAAFAPAIFFLVAILLPPLNHDVAAVLDFSRRWLAGEALYTDLIDVNPPLIFVLNLLPAAIARWTVLTQGQAILICLLAFAFALWRMTEALRRDREEGPVESAVLTAVLPLLLLAAGSDFGQRDVLMAMAALPYCLLAARRIEGLPTNRRLVVAVAVVAALAFALKPYFLAVPLLVEGLVWLRRGTGKARRDPVPWLMLGVWVAYLAAIPVFFPAYVWQILPLAWEFYGDIHGPGPWRVLVADVMGAAEVLLLFTVPLAFRRESGAFGQALAIAALGAFLAAWAQHKGWTYHVLPITLLGCGALAVAAARWADRALPEARARGSAPALALVAATAILVYQLRGGETPWREAAYYGETPGRLAEWFDRNAHGQSVLVLSPDIFPVYPALTYADARQMLHTMSTWTLQGFYRSCPGGDDPYRDPAVMRRSEYAVFHTVAEAFARHPPVALVVARPANIPACGGRFDLLAYFARHPLFGDTLERYVPAGEIDGYRLFLRRH
ncbi:hypothetical protein GWK16_11035 [Roseomonas sp. JC162]|uniref:Glycosyltransferase RgtA/B/C/D-like domain-containing protein n=1 Tax=Neoroseomonas marina TaxID=1232220 RepID=A0A848EE22_9PROT|nr:hypothetical protein [Neoroseomonas marina]NMJ41779.1 hypothetical protein [Neoroseomonas marina]